MTYVTVEGIDGSGKTTLVEGLVDELDDAVRTAEPDDTMWTGRAVREAMDRETEPWTDALLFCADRAEHLGRTVLPALEAGSTVVSDRGHDSTFAYQAPRLADVSDMDERETRAWLDGVYAPWNVEPDVTLWVDVPVGTALDRMSGEEKWANRSHLERVRDNYELLYDMNPTRIRWIDGEQEPERVLADAIEAVNGGGAP